MNVAEFRRELEKYDDDIPVKVSSVLDRGLRDAAIYPMVDVDTLELNGLWIAPNTRWAI